ncbi:MAG: 4-hydroxy-3-methylbut-2-enyl diphosphate reductase, partial [Gammaproteobacteria bacterium]|nr:4-hydroxy-3-methylbut-2-enyl diphosphate reductase [Gammaproteobacteria bacterium]
YNNSSKGKIYLVESVADVAKLELPAETQLAFVTQTTLSVDDTINIIDALRKRFPSIQGPRKDDICYATQNRQDSVKELSNSCDVILVVGSINSSNSNRLKELASNKGVDSYLIDNANELNRDWFTNKQRIGITAGASAPEILVKQVINKLEDWFAVSLHEDSKPKEQVVFQLPKELR